MSVGLRLYLVEKNRMENRLSLSPMMVLELVTRLVLMDQIEQLSIQDGVEIKAPLGLDFEDRETRKDKYDDRLKYLGCKEIADLIHQYPEEFRHAYKRHRNDAIADLLLSVDDQYVAVLYWC